VQSSLPDVVKGMWFCLVNHFFKASTGKVVMEFPLGNETGRNKPISKSCMDVVMKGKKKVEDRFEAKLHESFPSFRRISLRNVQVSQSAQMSDGEQVSDSE
jgi:hypothetical protein